jgi:RNA polymerase sigma factor (sigma-70 family)
VVVRLTIDSSRRELGRPRPSTKPDTGDGRQPNTKKRAIGGRPHSVSFDDDAHPLDLADENPNPDEELLAVETMTVRARRETALLDLLRALPPEDRRIIEARFLDGQKPREIAALTGQDREKIYRVLERTLARLKKVLT